MGIKKDVQLLLTFAVSSTTAAIALGLGSSSTTEDSIGIFRGKRVGEKLNTVRVAHFPDLSPSK